MDDSSMTIVTSSITIAFSFLGAEVLVVNKIEENTFYANHPFAFYIEDESTGTILYMGTVRNPLNESGIMPKVEREELPPRIRPNITNVTPNPGKQL